MLFNSFLYLLIFLPVSVAGFFVIKKTGGFRASLISLVAASLFFYAFWNPFNLFVLLTSLIVNYSLGLLLQKSIPHKKSILILGIIANILTLGFFKYTAFGIATVNSVFGFDFTIPTIVLPLAISFITFQKIAFLVDVYQGKTQEHNFLRFCAFVTFFPQLIAGPIVHHRELAPQLKQETMIFTPENIYVGIMLIIAGLFKKAVLADSLAPYVQQIFTLADNGHMLTFVEAWTGALAYTFQLYFDFSGYADMAIGSARLFGILLPLNFHAPYKSRSIIEFWKRWHITLSRFLRDYVYIALGGNRKGNLRKHLNLFLTMLIGGLWHGASWTFVFWGALHGTYLIINHTWRALCTRYTWLTHIPLFVPASYALTFLCVVVSWVFFRAETFHGAKNILSAMIGQNGIALPEQLQHAVLSFIGITFDLQTSALLPISVSFSTLITIFFCALIAFFSPTMYQLLHAQNPALDVSVVEPSRFSIRPSITTAFLCALITFVSLAYLALSQQSEFLYFQF